VLAFLKLKAQRAGVATKRVVHESFRGFICRQKIGVGKQSEAVPAKYTKTHAARIFLSCFFVSFVTAIFPVA
jgi:hypothetical protein